MAPPCVKLISPAVLKIPHLTFFSYKYSGTGGSVYEYNPTSAVANIPQTQIGAQNKKDRKKEKKAKKDKKQKQQSQGQENGAFFSPDMRSPDQLPSGFTHGTTGFVAPSSHDGGASVQSQGGAAHNSNQPTHRPVSGHNQMGHRGQAQAQMPNMGQAAMRYQNTAYGQNQVYSARPYQANQYGLQGSQQWVGNPVQRPAPHHKPPNYNMYKWPYQ